MQHQDPFDILRQRVARLGIESNPRYFLPHKPLLFLALGHAFRDVDGASRPLAAVVRAYRKMAEAGQQWPPQPLDALRRLHRTRFFTLQREGRPLPREGRLPLAGMECEVVLPDDLREFMTDRVRRRRLLAAAYFQFCPEQKVALAALWKGRRYPETMRWGRS